MMASSLLSPGTILHGAQACARASLTHCNRSGHLQASECGLRWQPAFRTGGSTQYLRPRRPGALGRRSTGVRASLAGGAGEQVPEFPRINVRDPYKRLGISPDASSEELADARQYLTNQYAGHEKSVESIEAAYDRIIAERLKKRKGGKMKISSKKEVKEPPEIVKRFLKMIERPDNKTIAQRLFIFVLIGVWSVVQSAETGPALQVFTALATSIYLLNDKVKNLTRAFILGFAGIAVGWVLGSIIPVYIPMIFPPTWGPELCTSLFAYLSLFIVTTFFK